MSSFRRVLERHPDGTVEVFHWDDAARRFAIEYVQNVGKTIEAVKEEAAETGGWTPGREMQHVASVPTVALMQMIQRYGPQVVKDIALMRRAVDDPEWRYLRIAKVIA
jgi:hypothetical protein